MWWTYWCGGRTGGVVDVLAEPTTSDDVEDQEDPPSISDAAHTATEPATPAAPATPVEPWLKLIPARYARPTSGNVTYDSLLRSCRSDKDYDLLQAEWNSIREQVTDWADQERKAQQDGEQS